MYTPTCGKANRGGLSWLPNFLGCEGALHEAFPSSQKYTLQARIQGGPGPPLTLGFEAPKLTIFGPYLIFP